MNKDIRDYINSLDPTTLAEVDELIKMHPVIAEIQLIVREGSMIKMDAIMLGFKVLMLENQTLKNQLFARIVEEQKHGRQIGKFTGFK